jgi:NTE family protein
VVGATTGIGLVLGGGGVVGQAYHAGVLAALEHDLGWDPRTADVVVGTSAGSITGTLLRGGVPASELAAWAVKAPLSAEGALLEDLFGTEHPTFTPLRLVDLFRRPPSLPGLPMLGAALRRPWRVRPLSAAMMLLARGSHDITEQLAALRQAEGKGGRPHRCGSVSYAAVTPGGSCWDARAPLARRCTWRSPRPARCPATSRR